MSIPQIMRWSALFVLAFAVVMSAGCGSDAKESSHVPKVRTMMVGESAGTESLSYTGTVEGRYARPLAFQITGQVIERLVHVGDRVQAGQVLARINPQDVRAQSDMGDAQVFSAKAQLNLAEVNLARYRALYASDAVAKSTLDQYQMNYDAALAAYHVALAQAAKGHHALSYATLTAPSDGVITSISIEAGQIAAVGQTAMTLVQEGELEAEINVPEGEVGSVAVGQAFTLHFGATDGKGRGHVREIAPVADSAARTYRVRISIDEPPRGIALGMTVTAERDAPVGAEEADVFTLPLTAIYQPLDQPLVWIYQSDGTVKTVPVRVEGYAGKNAVRVQGLSRGDRVVTAGVHTLAEGQAVRLERVP